MDVIKKYGVSLSRHSWRELPAKARLPLAKLGFGPDDYPHTFRDYFDTMQAAMMLCVADGHPIGILGKSSGASVPDENLFHVGGTSYWNAMDNVWKLRGAYFSLRVLETHKDAGLRKFYQKSVGNISAASIRRQIENAKKASHPGFFEFVERLIMTTGAKMDRPD